MFSTAAPFIVASGDFAPGATMSPERVNFVDGMASNAVDGEIARSLIGLAHSLGVGVTAEGVETQEQWDVLGRLGCDLVQGSFLARPLRADAATEWLRDRVASTAAPATR